MQKMLKALGKIAADDDFITKPQAAMMACRFRRHVSVALQTAVGTAVYNRCSQIRYNRSALTGARPHGLASRARVAAVAHSAGAAARRPAVARGVDDGEPCFAPTTPPLRPAMAPTAED